MHFARNSGHPHQLAAATDLSYWCAAPPACSCLLQALRWDPGNSQLEADLEEVQQCMRPLDAATLRQAGQRRFKMKACSLSARLTWGLTGTLTQLLPHRRAAAVLVQL